MSKRRKPSFRPEALGDLRSIRAFTVKRWGNDQAVHYLSAIRTVVNQLCGPNWPHLPCGEDIGPYFRAQSGSHVVYYRLEHDVSLIVVRILHERMDIPSQL